jgi:hypothetical protein
VEGIGKSKGMTGLALVAMCALALTVTVGSAASAAGGGAVELAKKGKCKKKGKGKASAPGKKKKGCKKKKPKPPAPLVRATITWTGAGSDDADLDLFVFDASGNAAAKGATAIPKTTMSPDLLGPSGSETFTDLAPNPARTFSFAVCYQVGGSVHAPFTITYITADGQSHTETRDPGSSFHYDFPGGAPIPAGYCPD